MKIMVINGPNLNMLGTREPEHYGSKTYAQLCDNIREHCKDLCEVVILQSNHEGELVDFIQQAYFDGFDGIVINPAAYTHTSVAILDAVKAVKLPCVEVHISDVSSREDFRQISYIRSACIGTVSGMGTDGYMLGIDKLTDYIKEKNE